MKSSVRLYILQLCLAVPATLAVLLALLYMDPYAASTFAKVGVYIAASIAVAGWWWLGVVFFYKRRRQILPAAQVVVWFRQAILLGILVFALLGLQSTGNFFWWSGAAVVLAVGGVEWLFRLS